MGKSSTISKLIPKAAMPRKIEVKTQNITTECLHAQRLLVHGHGLWRLIRSKNCQSMNYLLDLRIVKA